MLPTGAGEYSARSPRQCWAPACPSSPLKLQCPLPCPGELGLVQSGSPCARPGCSPCPGDGPPSPQWGLSCPTCLHPFPEGCW